MPATRVALALNSKQSQRAPLLIPSSTSSDPASPSSSRALVIKAAQAKFRLKKANRVFVAGTGQELLRQEDCEGVLKDDLVLLVSAGEDYVGLKKEEVPNSNADHVLQDGEPPSTEGNPNCTIQILAQQAYIDPQAVTQLETTGRTLPGIIHVVAQPDLHPGAKFPIGAVFVSKEWIHPPLIGGDIGCGMAWYKTTLSRSQVEGDKGRKVAEKLRGLEGAWRTQRDREVWLQNGDAEGESVSAGEEWDVALGTIGAGNHFAELQVVEEAKPNDDPANQFQHQLHPDEVVLLVHSGSRGYGGDILKRYTAGNRNSIHESSPLATSYLAEHDRACAWACKNRDLIALRFLSCLEPGNAAWSLGANSTTTSIPTPSDSILTAHTAMQTRKVVDIHHNAVSLAPWPPQPPNQPSLPSPSTATPQLPNPYLYIHRKGAAPTYSPKTHLPLPFLPLPGSRSTPTLILHPLHTPLNSYGHTNALSLAHGAGRAMSRHHAATYISQKYKGRAEDLCRGDWAKVDARGNKIAPPSTKNLPNGGGGSEGEDGNHGFGNDEEGRKVNGGSWVVCDEKQLVWEEASEAYKDVWDVGADLVRAGVAEGWGWCRGRVSYKVRRE